MSLFVSLQINGSKGVVTEEFSVWSLCASDNMLRRLNQEIYVVKINPMARFSNSSMYIVKVLKSTKSKQYILVKLNYI